MDSSFGSQIATAQGAFLLVATILLIAFGVALAFVVPWLFHHVSISVT